MVTKSERRAGKQKKEVAGRPLKADQAQAANGNGLSPSNQEVLRRLYASMLKCRMLAERARVLPGGQMLRDNYDFDRGHEAVVVGATVELGPQDTMVASPRNFAAHIAKGTSLEALISRARPENGGQTVGVPLPSFGLDTCPNPFNLATGLALAHKLEKTRNVVIALCSADETFSPERLHEAMKFAGNHKLPIIYIKGAELGPAKRGPVLEELSFMARECGFPAIVVDGKDAVALWRVVHESVHRARNGAGPTMIECEVESSSTDDPLAHMEHYMKKRGVWDEGLHQETANRIDAEDHRLL